MKIWQLCNFQTIIQRLKVSSICRSGKQRNTCVQHLCKDGAIIHNLFKCESYMTYMPCNLATIVSHCLFLTSDKLKGYKSKRTISNVRYLASWMIDRSI